MTNMIDTLAREILSSAEMFAAICGNWQSAAECARDEAMIAALPGASAIRSATNAQIIAVEIDGVGRITLSDARSLAGLYR